MIKFILHIVFIFVFVLQIQAQNKNQGDIHKPSVVRVESGQFSKTDPEPPTGNVQQIQGADGVTYYTTAGGIYLTLPKASNSVKLFALTGQLIWSGDLVQGRFFIPTGQGIYFLRINNKSYKVSCK